MSKFMKAAFALLLVSLAGGTASAQFGPDASTQRSKCNNTKDDDGDGKTDYSPTPGQGDPGCDGWNDDDETDLNQSVRIKARIALLFDTSGSMCWNVCGPEQPSSYTGGDGTLECPGNAIACNVCNSATCGNNVPDDARMFKVKRGVSDAVAAYGEIEYSLYRFFQKPVANTGNNCPSDGGAQDNGGWQGSLRGDSTPDDPNRCTEGSGGNFIDYARGERLVSFAPENQRDILMWMDGQDNWGSASQHPPAGNDYELRGTGFTPIAGSLDTIRAQLVQIRTAEGDIGTCRPYRVIVITDGDDRCHPQGTAGAAAAADALNDVGIKTYVVGFASPTLEDEMNQIAVMGGTGQAYFADEPAELSAALAEIAQQTALVEKCNDADDDCDGEKDNGFNKGPCNNGKVGRCYEAGFFRCASLTTTECVIAHDPAHDPVDEVPLGCNGVDDDCDGIIDNGLTCAGCGTEICNGRDDDCDGMTDEGDLPGEGVACGFDEGECRPGHFECTGGRLVCTDQKLPTGEVCNGKDDNCDGQIDGLTRECYTAPTGCVDIDSSPNAVKYQCKGRCRPGTQTCTIMTQPAYGTCLGEVTPMPEICNGADDNCDGQVDEGFNVGDECEIGTGLCKTKGKLICSPDGSGVVCDAPVIMGTGEVCNGIDDDCNGTIDDLPSPAPSPIGEPCGTCGGVYQCKGGLVCTGGAANPETCNGDDDDCNGVVDDGILPGVGEPCVPIVGGQPAFMVTGECKAGHKECVSGGLACVGYSGPNPEVCNGKDDNCDGVTDDMAACPSPTDACYQAACVSPCGEGEFPCPFGYFCKQLGSSGRFCIPNPCTGKVCSTGEVCDPNSGMCIDPCEGVECTNGTSCRGGRCVDCFTTGCPTGQACVEDSNRIGHCTADRCAGVTCGENQTCQDGTCVAVACAGGCKSGEVCDDGACVARCSADLCFGANCASGQVCNPSTGRCITDPCLRANCGNAACSTTCDGEATCGLKSGVDVLATGSGGFQCEIGPAVNRSRDALPALLLFAGVALVIRRRRR